MNSDKLLEEVEARIERAGIPQLITEFVNEHPEYWTNNKDIPGYNTSLDIDICFNGVPGDVKPFYMLGLGSYSKIYVSRNKHESHIEKSRIIEGTKVSDAYTYDTVKTFDPVETDPAGYAADISRKGCFNMAVHKWTAGKYQNEVCNIINWTEQDFRELFDRLDCKNGIDCYEKNNRHFIEVHGSCWSNTRTGEIGQDEILIELF